MKRIYLTILATILSFVLFGVGMSKEAHAQLSLELLGKLGAS